MRCKAVILAILGLGFLAGAANAGGNREAHAHTIGCRQNVGAKVKAGKVKKVDFQAEYSKCMEDPNYQ
jgi:hypothetical protein